VTKRLSDNVIIINTATDMVIDSFPVGDGPWGVSDFIVCINDSIPVPPTFCGTLFHDSGGPDEIYGIDEDTVTIICPDNANQLVLVEFLDFNVESNWDALYVFNGNSINSPPISSGNPATNSGFPAGGYYGSTIPGPFQSNDTSGCLTFRFLSDNSINLDGWEATIDCIARPVNDLCANAILIECSDLVNGTNVNATFDTDSFCISYPGTSGVWYKLIGTGDTITLTTCHPSSDFDTQIHVYTGTCSDFECVTGNDDDPLCGQSTLYSTVEFLSVPGEEYYILISGFQSSSGQFTLQVTCGSTPSDNNCLHFDGINDNVYGPSNSLFELVDGTIEVWVKPENKATSQTFISYRNDNGSSTRYLFNFLGNLSGLGFWNGTSYATFAYAFTANQWYHLAFVDDGVNTKIYINGVYAGSFNLQFSSASGSGLHLVLGYDIPLSEYYKGALDEIRIWSSPLPESVLFENMSCGISVTGDCLVAYYKFNQGIPSGANGSITTLLDQSGNNLNATLQNFTLSGTTSNWIEATNGVTDTCENPSFQNIVTSSLDGVYGSLRTTIACAESGSTITFSPDLPSDTLTILTPIPINKIITVNGVSIPGLLLDASTSTYAFDIQSNGIVDLFSLQVKCGTHPQYSGLRNNGITGLHDIIFETNMNSPILSNYNSLTLHGLTSLFR
jgi:YVTN family beta-propeller protein